VEGVECGSVHHEKRRTSRHGCTSVLVVDRSFTDRIVSVNANTFRSNIIRPKLSKSVIVVDIALKAGRKHCEFGTAHISAS